MLPLRRAASHGVGVELQMQIILVRADGSRAAARVFRPTVDEGIAESAFVQRRAGRVPDVERERWRPYPLECPDGAEGKAACGICTR